MSSKNEHEELIKTFKSFDKNGNGTISKDELLDGYRELHIGRMSEEEIRKEVDDIMDRIDIDGSGMIDYSEWAVGTINKKNILTQAKLKKAF